MTQRTPHTRESDERLLEILWECRKEAKCWETNRSALTENGEKYLREDVALAAMRRVSTPLTPSDEMVEGTIDKICAVFGYDRSVLAPNDLACLQAALNLMGGKK